MSEEPVVSFIVLSYNYRKYIVETIRSIFAQTCQNFEIIVVDDCSSDDSVEVLRTFSDSRLRIIVNETNLGGASSYNIALRAARGQFLVNLDADDWISPEKTEIQLNFLMNNPSISVVGTYIDVVDKIGSPHSNAKAILDYCNRTLDLNDPLSWIVENPLCRSSTMVRRDAHDHVGSDDEGMTYACDYELWLRFLKRGYQFAVIPQQLTLYRMHGNNITHKNPEQQFLEISYLLTNNLSRLLDDRGLFLGNKRIMKWIVSHPSFSSQPAKARYAILNRVFNCEECSDFNSYCRAVLSEDDSKGFDYAKNGRRLLGFIRDDDSHINWNK